MPLMVELSYFLVLQRMELQWVLLQKQNSSMVDLKRVEVEDSAAFWVTISLEKVYVWVTILKPYEVEMDDLQDFKKYP